MLTLPCEIVAVLDPFAHLFSARVWQHAILLLVGAILTPGQRTISSALRVMGLQNEPHFQNYHRVLNRARWPSRQLGQILLRLLVVTLWYPKSAPTFAETLAFVWQHLWSATISSTSPANADIVLIPRTFLQRLTDAVGFAA